MLAVQFKTIQKPVERETRSVWELREDLEKEKQKQVQLNREISEFEMLRDEYLQTSLQDRVAVMEEARDKLKQQAGLTSVIGEGIVITIAPLFHEELLGQEVPKLTTELLLRLMNEVNMMGIEHVSIGNQRMTGFSAIREVNGETFVNNRPLSSLPIEIKLVTDDAMKVYDQLKASKINDEFANENLSITIELQNELRLNPYERKIDIVYMEHDKEGS